MKPTSKARHGCGTISIAVAAVAQIAVASANAEIKVVASSKPVHALVASVMGQTGVPVVLVSGAASPHSYSMKPSDAKAANGARVLFRISEGLEPFTAKLAKSLPKSVRVVSLVDAPGLKLLGRRETGAFEADGHDGHGHGATKKSEPEDERDPHIWLDPANASVMVDHIAAVLADAEPANAAVFRANAEATKERIAELAVELERDLLPFAGKPFVVLHDAYQYLEQRFGLTAVGSIAVAPEAAPSGKRLSAIRKKISATGAACLFAEPGMQPKVVAAVIEGTKVKAGLLDPEATQLSPSANVYVDLMRGLASGIKACFSAK
ncbi:MAG: zinc ABC transporter substrate-binding protein [Hyphomicrobiaceae bacterium]